MNIGTMLHLEERWRFKWNGCNFPTVKQKEVKNLLKTSTFFKHFLPTLCATVEIIYNYTIYIGYDYNDVILGNEKNKNTFMNLARENLKQCKTHTSM